MRSESDPGEVVVLLTCHNRRETTLRCLRSLYEATAAPDKLRICLVDDGSKDGTADAVAQMFPAIHIVRGSGHLYWAGGMRLAYESSKDWARRFTLWLNDDVVLEQRALEKLIEVAEEKVGLGAPAGLVAGAFKDPATGQLTYSGLVRESRLRPLRFKTLPPSSEPQPCDAVHGNLVLVSEQVRMRLGNLDPGFTHGIADMDYSLRAKALGFEVWLAPGYAGYCSFNAGPVAEGPSLPPTQRIRSLMGVKNLPPKEWARFARRHGGPFWPAYWISPYVRTLVSALRASAR